MSGYTLKDLLGDQVKILKDIKPIPHIQPPTQKEWEEWSSKYTDDNSWEMGANVKKDINEILMALRMLRTKLERYESSGQRGLKQEIMDDLHYIILFMDPMGQ